jgi:gluconolactonase
VAAVAANTAASAALASPIKDATPRRPDAVLDLATKQGAGAVQGQWRYSDAKVEDIDSRGVGSDLRATGAPNRTYDITPHAGSADYDDSRWQWIAPEGLETRRSGGKVCFAWYRIGVTIPEKIGPFATAGSTVVFELVIDDYAEIWIDGRLPRELGQTGGQLVKGFNAPNRVILTRDAHPGQRLQIAVFGMNGPLSDPPGNFIWIRSATLDFYSAEHARVGTPVSATVERIDAEIDEIVPRDFEVEQIAEGFSFIEGPVWVEPAGGVEGYLLFSDPNDNVIYRWSENSGVSVYKTKSGYSGGDIGEYGQPGSNGLTLDSDGRLTIDEHGRRRVVRQEKNGQITVLADRYDGKRLNSPNDLVYRSDGSLYFTDPPFGLPKFHEDPRRELAVTGVFRVDSDGTLALVSTDLAGPNGIAFSPDEQYLYVTNWDTATKVIMRYQVQADGTLRDGKVFFDMTGAPGEEALDGLKIDKRGNLYASGPGGVWIISPAGKHLGTMKLPQLPANFAWGDADGKTLYMTARNSLYRARMSVEGVRPQPH